MKQIISSLKTGVAKVLEVPVPRVSPGSLLVKTSNSLVSTGTERMLIDFGKAGWIKKVKSQPEKAKEIVNKITTDGFVPTMEAVFNKLDEPLQLGYCNVGIIHEVGSNIKNFNKGDRVISNGKHAEVVNVPVNLCAKIPDNVSNEEASFTVIGAVALQGIRLVKPTLGEAIVVIGLGLVGLMTVQLLLANGCRVLGADFEKERLNLAKKFGAEVIDLNEVNPLTASENFSRGRGVDAVIITTSTADNKPIHQAANMCRKRGRIVLVGTSGLKLSRNDFYKKEISFQVSASYGPGRYDPNYEENGQDYPIGFVRWTEQRNFEAVLDMMARGSLNVKSLISHRFEISESEKAFEIISTPKSSSLGILISYPGITITDNSRQVSLNTKLPIKDLKNTQNKVNVSFVGSGNYATRILIPLFKSAGVDLRYIASNSGVSSAYAGSKFGFKKTTTDINNILSDDKTDTVVIATRHNNHAESILKSLKAKKNIFVEKPLCLTLEELKKIELAYSEPLNLMIGFNRRFAPQIKKTKDLLDKIQEPKAIVITVNAGAIEKGHWTQNIQIGGGRILGEACHFIDLIIFLIGKPLRDYHIKYMDSYSKDTATIQLSFKDGSIGTVHYLSNGSKTFPKERIEIFSGGGILILDNFLKLTGYGWPGFRKMNLWRQDKGQEACVKAFVNSIIKSEKSPIPINEIFEVSKISIELANN